MLQQASLANPCKQLRGVRRGPALFAASTTGLTEPPDRGAGIFWEIGQFAYVLIRALSAIRGILCP